MTAALPPSFLFRYAVPVSPMQPPGKRRGHRLFDLADRGAMSVPAELHGDPLPFELRAGWCDAGLGLEWRVAVETDSKRPGVGETLRLWIDTRSTQSIHRASRYCHEFRLTPFDEQSGGPRASQRPIDRAREQPPLVEPESLPIAVQATDFGYTAQLWLSQAVLNGYDPELSPRLGFFAARYLATGKCFPFALNGELPFDSDPSLWTTLELVAE